MNDRPIGAGMNCEDFLEALERLPREAPGAKTAGAWLELLRQEAREHARKCPNCEAALEDFADARRVLEPLRATAAKPGPWFALRVMASIRAKEIEMEEQANSVWVSVRRLAPRLAAFAAVLLVLGGTWALEVRRAYQNREQQVRPVEGLFDAAPSAPWNDDIVASTYEERQP